MEMRNVLDIEIVNTAGEIVHSQLLMLSEVRFINAMLKDHPGATAKIQMVQISRRSFELEFGLPVNR